MSISDKLTRLASAREDIIDALADKGVTATGHGFEDFPDDIAAITGGGGGGFPVLHGLPLGQFIPDMVRESQILMDGVWHDGNQYWISDTCQPCITIDGVKKSKTITRCATHAFSDEDDLFVVNKGMEWSPGGIITNGTESSLPGTCILSTHFVSAGLINDGETVVISGTNIRFYYPRMQSYPIALWKSWLRREISGGRTPIVVYAVPSATTIIDDPIEMYGETYTENIIFYGQTTLSDTPKGNSPAQIQTGIIIAAYPSGDETAYGSETAITDQVTS